MAQHGIDGIEQIGTHHTDFVDDEKLQLLQYFSAGSRKFTFRNQVFPSLRDRGERSEGQLKERMDRDASGVDRRHSRRGNDGHLLLRMLTEMLQKSRLAGPGLAGQKNGTGRLLDELFSQSVDVDR